jgi:predicted MPP superfamily phosphohydrolase
MEVFKRGLNPARFLTDYTAGLFQRPLGTNMDRRTLGALCVNRGLGTLGAPVRIGAPPEITLITLRAVDHS